MSNVQLNDRVEYAVRLKYDLDDKHKVDARRLCVGFVKRIFRKHFTTYVEICEHKTRRVDCVRLKDVYGRVAANEYRTKPNKYHHGN